VLHRPVESKVECGLLAIAYFRVFSEVFVGCHKYGMSIQRQISFNSACLPGSELPANQSSIHAHASAGYTAAASTEFRIDALYGIEA
jgi:hypothetical protein